MGYSIKSSHSSYSDIVASREDIFDYLFHFTKGPNALDTLRSILSQQRLRKGKKNPICFTETPLLFLPEMFDFFNKHYPNNPMYAPYGIGFKKNYIFEKGGRPAIYGKEEEKKKLSSDIQWRFVKYNPKDTDFTWLREWRIDMPELCFDNTDCIVVTKNDAQLFSLTQDDGELENFIIDYYTKDGQHIVESHQGQIPIRHYKGISFEELKECCQTKQDFYNLLSWQDLSDAK